MYKPLRILRSEKMFLNLLQRDEKVLVFLLQCLKYLTHQVCETYENCMNLFKKNL